MVFEVVAMQETDVPEVALPMIVFSMCIAGLLALSARYWVQGLMRWMTGQAVFPKPEPRRIQRWGFVDLIFALLAVVGLQLVGFYSGVLFQIGDRPGPDGQPGLNLMTWISAVQTFAAIMVTVFIATRCSVSASSIGWSLARLSYDTRLGFKAFVVLAPPVYLLMIVVTLLSGQEYKHPIHEMASDNPWMLLPAVFMAVVLAPIGEEFAFRVLLQGFLESLSVGRFSVEKFFLGRVFDPELRICETIAIDRSVPEFQATSNPSISDSSNPYVAMSTTLDDDKQPIVGSLFGERLSADESVDSTDQTITETSLPWWPMIVSGLLFGLAHIEYGMSWIPLTVLGIALGWLYRVTNRIWPSLVVHFCVNATSMIGFSLTVLFGDPHAS